MPTTDPLPPVTDAHRRQAFSLFNWPGITFEAAMAVDLRRRLIEACAHGIRTRQHQAKLREQAKARYSPWCQSVIFGARTPTSRPASALPPGHIDRKRAAAGDLDS